MDNGPHRSFIRREGDVVLGVDGEVVILASYEFHFIRVIFVTYLMSIYMLSIAGFTCEPFVAKLAGPR